jgi:hypothetical protein
VLSDLAYAEVYFDDNPPPSILQVPGAIDVAVEFTSMSKTFSMPGWRIGFAVGNERLIAALTRVKSYLDYGAFTPIQVAAAAALNGPDDCIDEMRAIYKKRRDVPWSTASAAPAGRFRRRAPRCSPGRRCRSVPELGSVKFAKLLIEKAEVAVSPRHRLRRAWRRLCAHRAGRERAAHPPGRAQYPPFPRQRGQACTTSFLSPRAASVGIPGTRHGCTAQGGSRRFGHGRFGRGKHAGGKARTSAAERAGRPIEVVAVAAKDPPREGRRRYISRLRNGSDPVALATDPGHRRLRRVDGRRGRSGQGVRRGGAWRGKAVVTANKALLAKHGNALGEARRKEARRSPSRRRSPAASRSSRRCARAWRAQQGPRVYGILNGTCNYILTKMLSGAALLCRLSEGSAAARLCGGRSHVRHRRLRHRAQDSRS